jgi:hypothetical protein
LVRQLIDLALDDAQGDVAEQADDVQTILAERQRHRLEVEEIAEQDGDVIAPARVHGVPSAPQIGVVDDVVVHQRRGVDELDHRRIQHRAVVPRLRPGRP